MMTRVAVAVLAFATVAAAAPAFRHGTPDVPNPEWARNPNGPLADPPAPSMYPAFGAHADDAERYQLDNHHRAGDGSIIIHGGAHPYNADGAYKGKCCQICSNGECKTECGPACQVAPGVKDDSEDTYTDGGDGRIGDQDMVEGYDKMKAVMEDGDVGGPNADWARHPEQLGPEHGATGSGAYGPIDVEPHIAITGGTGATGATGGDTDPIVAEPVETVGKEAPKAEDEEGEIVDEIEGEETHVDPKFAGGAEEEQNAEEMAAEANEDAADELEKLLAEK